MTNDDAIVETQGRIDGLMNGVNAHEMCLRHLLAEPRCDEEYWADLARHNKEIKEYNERLAYYEYILELLKSKEES